MNLRAVACLSVLIAGIAELSAGSRALQQSRGVLGGVKTVCLYPGRKVREGFIKVAIRVERALSCPTLSSIERLSPAELKEADQERKKDARILALMSGASGLVSLRYINDNLQKLWHFFLNHQYLKKESSETWLLLGKILLSGGIAYATAGLAMNKFENQVVFWEKQYKTYHERIVREMQTALTTHSADQYANWRQGLAATDAHISGQVRALGQKYQEQMTDITESITAINNRLKARQ